LIFIDFYLEFNGGAAFCRVRIAAAGGEDGLFLPRALTGASDSR
jgi:hypothetical protein